MFRTSRCPLAVLALSFCLQAFTSEPSTFIDLLNSKEPVDYTRAALTLAVEIDPKIDPAVYEQKIDLMAKEIMEKTRNAKNSKETLEIFSKYLYETKNYHSADCENLLLNEVIDTKQGSCWGLSLLAFCLGQKCKIEFKMLIMDRHVCLVNDKRIWETTNGNIFEISSDAVLENYGLPAARTFGLLSPKQALSLFVSCALDKTGDQFSAGRLLNYYNNIDINKQDMGSFAAWGLALLRRHDFVHSQNCFESAAVIADATGLPDKALLWYSAIGNLDGVSRMLTRLKNSHDELIIESVLHFAKTPQIADLLLANGYDINAKGYAGLRPLTNAIVLANDEVGDFLLKHGAKIDEQDDAAKLLHMAASNNLPKTVEQLLERGIDVDSVFHSQTPLHRACLGDNLAVVKVLVSKGAALNAKDDDGRTALHLAASSGDVEMVKFLLSNGAPRSAVDNWGWTPLDYARDENSEDVVHVLEAQTLELKQ